MKATKIREQNFSDFENILKIFDDDYSATIPIKTLKEIYKFKTPEPSKPKIEIEIEWTPTLPLMNKAGYEGIGVDMLPVTSGVENGRLSLVLAGSSIKGALRSHAERIMRTLLNIQASGEFNEQIKNVPIAEELFGAKKEKTSTNPKLGLGALSIDDCYSIENFDQKTWQEVVEGKLYDDKSYFEKVIKNENGREVEEVTLHRALRKIDLGRSNVTDVEVKEKTEKFAVSHHTAIDRFTGGAADGALYSVLAPHNIAWQPIKMSLDFGRAGENEKQCLMLVLLLLRDLAENRLPLGFATNRGMGEVKIKSFKITPKNLDDIVSGEIWIGIENGKFVASENLNDLGGEKLWEKL